MPDAVIVAVVDNVLELVIFVAECQQSAGSLVAILIDAVPDEDVYDVGFGIRCCLRVFF